MGTKSRSTSLLISMVLAATFSLSGQASASLLPGTGQTKCYDNREEISCPGPGEPFYGQDANYPRPRSYTKLGMDGLVLADSASREEGWLMTRDNVTGLTWEVKTGDGSIHDRDNTFTWCDRNPDTNGGSQGTCGTGTGDAATDTEAFIKALNDNRFGGFSDWRLPDRNELQSLVDYSRYEPAVVPILAGNTVFSPEDTPYCSSTTAWSTSDGKTYRPFHAWLVDFLGGWVSHNEKFVNYYVRAVRSADSGPPAESVILRGIAVERDIQGNPLSPLSGVTVQVSGIGTVTTGSSGEFSFEYFSPGTYMVSASRDGYYTVSREITLNPWDRRNEMFYLLTAQQAGDPVVFVFESPGGKHFIEGMPGDLSFEATIAWNGNGGSARFLVGGQWKDARPSIRPAARLKRGLLKT